MSSIISAHALMHKQQCISCSRNQLETLYCIMIIDIQINKFTSIHSFILTQHGGSLSDVLANWVILTTFDHLKLAITLQILMWLVDLMLSLNTLLPFKTWGPISFLTGCYHIRRGLLSFGFIWVDEQIHGK
jgi:hypothetical protein